MTLAISNAMWTVIGFAIVYFLLTTAIVLSLCQAAARGDQPLREAPDRPPFGVSRSGRHPRRQDLRPSAPYDRETP